MKILVSSDSGNRYLNLMCHEKANRTVSSMRGKIKINCEFFSVKVCFSHMGFLYKKLKT